MFTFYCDPGHGWLQVTLADMVNVGLKPENFSQYSYRSRRTRDNSIPVFYLEEDCDASKFVDAYVALNKCQPKIKEVYQEHTFIRDLPRIW